MPAPVTKLILFCYDGSVFSRKMEYYLTLRRLSYERCIQPPLMPRPDLARLGVHYRRIPILAIGRDIYCDTRIIIEKLEQMFPDTALGSRSPFEQGLERIFEAWVIDAGPFWRTAGCMPLDLPVLQNQAFMDDRGEASGGAFSLEALQKDRGMNLAHLQMYFDTVEKLLGDGRHFLFATPTPSLIDIHTVFCFDWAMMLLATSDTTGIAEHDINDKSYPAVYAWVERFREAFRTAEIAESPKRISSDDAIQSILDGQAFETDLGFDKNDPLSLHHGQKVTVTPTDFGFTHSDVGNIVSLTKREVVIESRVPDDQGLLQLHFPRNNFRIEVQP